MPLSSFSVAAVLIYRGMCFHLIALIERLVEGQNSIALSYDCTMMQRKETRWFRLMTFCAKKITTWENWN